MLWCTCTCTGIDLCENESARLGYHYDMLFNACFLKLYYPFTFSLMYLGWISINLNIFQKGLRTKAFLTQNIFNKQHLFYHLLFLIRAPEKNQAPLEWAVHKHKTSELWFHAYEMHENSWELCSILHHTKVLSWWNKTKSVLGRFNEWGTFCIGPYIVLPFLMSRQTILLQNNTGIPFTCWLHIQTAWLLSPTD